MLYVGKAKDVKSRVSSYFAKSADLPTKTRLLIDQVKKIETIEVTSEIEALLLEANLIKKHLPKYNTRLTDGKSYPYIRITAKDEYPKVLIARDSNDPKSLYFGPFPSSQAMRSVLKIMRKLFPYQNVANHPNRICLYNHLGLCPCPTVLGGTGYKKNIRRIIKFLSGGSQKLILELEKERDQMAKDEEFEVASFIQRKIDYIKLVTSPVYKPFEYENNPDLRAEVLSSEMEVLKETLNLNGLKIDNLRRIECYDISNIQGIYATGSLVVFINGERDTSFYRRFKIRRDYKNKPNDFGMMYEVISRRLKHEEWETPGLIVVDGGKGQVTSAMKALFDQNKNIPLIGLAKREETIITPDLKEISLSKNSKGLHLIMRIRDEAHRFAITYHRKLRSKYLLG